MRYYRSIQVCVEELENYPVSTISGEEYYKVGAFVSPSPFISYIESDDTPDNTIVLQVEDSDLNGSNDTLSVYLLKTFPTETDKRATLMAENNNGDSLHLTIITFTKFECRDLAYKDIWAIDLPINMRSEPLVINENAIVQGVTDMILTSAGERWMRPTYGISSLRALVFRVLQGTGDTNTILEEIERKISEFFRGVFLIKQSSVIDIEPNENRVSMHLTIFIGGEVKQRVVIRESFLI